PAASRPRSASKNRSKAATRKRAAPGSPQPKRGPCCCAEFAVRDFLDSRHGRHFADDVSSGLFNGLSLPVAIDAAVDRWMNWRIDRRTLRETGIPRRLPCLLGLVADCEI